MPHDNPKRMDMDKDREPVDTDVMGFTELGEELDADMETDFEDDDPLK